ncbi:open rectifier K[+] channel 1 isoform X2 [Rhodnius prolixus]|uniref:open rectifier K[+] channel 1 isoform X2 n=1 Tax=Rhodnius prolixus TaxID=13249 RepID=UPI003D18AE56
MYILDLLARHYSAESNQTMAELTRDLSIYCGKTLLVNNESHLEDTQMPGDSEPYVWTYYNSFFFALTTLSTIGYGNLTPSSTEGRWLVIVYSLIGIPFNGIVLAQLGDFFGSTFMKAHHRYKNQVYETRMELILDILLYLVPGMAIFILAPTFVFQFFENWSFTEGIYYAFVSLTTIGFGDFVAGQKTDDSASYTAYRIFLLIWIMFGLGYLVMILGFIARAMKSKRINKLEHKLANTIKYTQSKIWNEFVQDVNYLRRALNEVYLLKIKPVYKDKHAKPLISDERRTVSCPDLSEWPVLRRKSEIQREQNVSLLESQVKRRRALSENVEDLRARGMNRVMSEGALEQIDRTATFEKGTASAVAPDTETDELLARIAERRLPVAADHSIDEEGGLHLFSDEDILQSEVHSTQGSWNCSWGRANRPMMRRRAGSDAPYTEQHLPLAITDRAYDRQKTWSGVDSLHTRTLIKNMRARGGEGITGDVNVIKEEKDRPTSGLRRLSMAALAFFSDKQRKKSKENGQIKTRRTGNTFSRNSSSHRLSLQENDLRSDSPLESDVYLTAQGVRRPSLLEALAPHQIGNNPPAISPVLEQTTLADFIRVMASLRRLEEQAHRRSQNGSVRQSRHPSLSYLFSQQQIPQNGERRLSQTAVGRGPEILTRRRAASVTPVAGGVFPIRPSRNSVPQQVSPSFIITPPEERHRFSVHNVPSRSNTPAARSRAESLTEIITNP